MKFWKKKTAVLAAAVLLCCMMSTAVSAAEMPDTSEVKNQIDAALAEWAANPPKKGITTLVLDPYNLLGHLKTDVFPETQETLSEYVEHAEEFGETYTANPIRMPKALKSKFVASTLYNSTNIGLITVVGTICAVAIVIMVPVSAILMPTLIAQFRLEDIIVEVIDRNV